VKTTKVRINIDAGIHARPASLFVKTASGFESEIFVEKDGQKVNGKSIMGILMLALSKDSLVEISADGKDEDDAVAALSALIESDFQEPE